MNKNLLLSFFIFFSISYGIAQCGFGYDYTFTNFYDIEKGNLKGEVKNVTYSYYEGLDKFGKLLKGKLSCKEEISFNQDKTINKIKAYNSNGEIINVQIHEYMNGEIKLISLYNKVGKLLAKTAFASNENKIKEQRYSADAQPNDRWFLRTFDSIGRMTTLDWNNQYDKNKTMQTFYYYDKYNRVKKAKTDNDIIEIKYNRSSNKLPMKIETFDSKSGELTNSKQYEFDSNNNIIKEYKNDVLRSSYEYTYDKRGNWMKRIEFKTEAKIPLEIIDRQIVYYN